MPVSKHRKGHAKKALQRKNELIQYKNRMEKAYREMYEKFRDKATSMGDMLNQEEKEKLPAEPTQPNTDLYKSDTVGWRTIDMPESDPNEPVSIVSQWPADMQLPEIEQTITTSNND